MRVVVIAVVAGLVVAGMAGAAPASAAPAYDSGGSGMTARKLDDARRAAYHGRISEAIALCTQVLAGSPNYGLAYSRRASLYMDAGRYAEAEADLSRVGAMHPDDMALAMRRVEMLVWQGNGAAALAALKAALQLPLLSATHAPFEAGTYEAGYGQQFEVNGHMEARADMYGSIANQLLHRDDASIADMQAMLKLESQHPEHILADYCYASAVAGLLESAELACEEAIADNAHDIGQYDSLGFAHLRMKQWDKAVADYDKALASRPDMTLSLYGRGLAKTMKGDKAGGAADLAAAKRDEPDIEGIMRRLGVTAS